jgi:NAD(P)-dependent dehydrogenase (short-subunit alcohol dehydrogenase family)
MFGVEMRGFEGKSAIITGGTRGIGLAIASRLVAGGAQVVVTGRKAESLMEAVDALGGAGHAMGIAGNAADSRHRHEVVQATLDTYGRVDFVVNNAGINPVYGNLMELDLDAARRVIEVNCLGALAWTQAAFVPWMHQHGGAVVNVASIAGISAAKGVGFYGASKAMLIHLTRQMAHELGPAIRVNAVAPGVVKTEFAAALYEGRESAMIDQYPMKRLGVPDDVAGATAFLLSEEASWITGQLLVIDGGVTLASGDA